MGSLPDQRGSYVPFTARPLPLGRHLSWLLPVLPAPHSPFPAPQGLTHLCLATGSTSSGTRSCQIQLLESSFLYNKNRQKSNVSRTCISSLLSAKLVCAAELSLRFPVTTGAIRENKHGYEGRQAWLASWTACRKYMRYDGCISLMHCVSAGNT